MQYATPRKMSVASSAAAGKQMPRIAQTQTPSVKFTEKRTSIMRSLDHDGTALTAALTLARSSSESTMSMI